jgi:intraflagellar transport protein 81
LAESEKGIVGYHKAHNTLEKVSEMKSEKDEEKGQKLNEISLLVEKLSESINVGYF